VAGICLILPTELGGRAEEATASGTGVAEGVLRETLLRCEAALVRTRQKLNEEYKVSTNDGGSIT
jgi:hypothetical protein